MFAELGLENWDVTGAALVAGLLLGAIFGFAAQRSRFCLRLALVGQDRGERGRALALWLVALAVALLAVQAALASSPLDLSGHRYLETSLPLGGLLLGGLLFGAGMVLARGCASRLTVLGASGNLRALTVLLVFAVVAFSTMKGLLSPLRVGLAEVTSLDLAAFGLAEGSLPALFGAWIVPALVLATAALALFLAFKARLGLPRLAAGAAIGGVVAAGWYTTGYLLYDDFDPIAAESIAFTLPMTDSLFYLIASSSVQAGFGVGLICGVLGGALLASLLFGEFTLQSFESPRQTLRYGLGGLFMGFGGVLAGGCTVGNGLSGTATLGIAPILGLAAIAFGALATHRLLALKDGEQGSVTEAQFTAAE